MQYAFATFENHEYQLAEGAFHDSMTHFRRTSKVVVVISKGQKKKSILGLEDRQRRGRNRKSLKPPSQVKLCGGGGTSALVPGNCHQHATVWSSRIVAYPGAHFGLYWGCCQFLGPSIICCVRQVDLRTNQSACRPYRTPQRGSRLCSCVLGVSRRVFI